LPLSEKLNIDPYIVGKFLGETNRDKALILGGHLFLAISMPDWQEEQFKKQEVKFIITSEYIITSTQNRNKGIELFKEKFEKNANFEKGEEFENPVVYSFLHIFEKIYENMIFELQDIEKKINDVEEHIFSGNEKGMVRTISQTNRHLIDFKKNIRGHEET
jgi:Mg2+ and Co2+ transporter CorA